MLQLISFPGNLLKSSSYLIFYSHLNRFSCGVKHLYLHFCRYFCVLILVFLLRTLGEGPNFAFMPSVCSQLSDCL